MEPTCCCPTNIQASKQAIPCPWRADACAYARCSSHVLLISCECRWHAKDHPASSTHPGLTKQQAFPCASPCASPACSADPAARMPSTHDSQPAKAHHRCTTRCWQLRVQVVGFTTPRPVCRDRHLPAPSAAAPWHSALQERKKLAAPAPSGSARPLFRTAAAAAFSVAASACCLDQPAWCGQVWLMISEACTWPPGARHPAEGTGLLPGQRRPHAHATLPVLQRGAASPLLGMVLSLEPRPTRRVCGVFALMDPLSTTATPGL